MHCLHSQHFRSYVSVVACLFISLSRRLVSSRLSSRDSVPRPVLVSHHRLVASYSLRCPALDPSVFAPTRPRLPPTRLIAAARLQIAPLFFYGYCSLLIMSPPCGFVHAYICVLFFLACAVSARSVSVIGISWLEAPPANAVWLLGPRVASRERRAIHLYDHVLRTYPILPRPCLSFPSRPLQTRPAKVDVDYLFSGD
jgi:hypothetical protein